MNLIKKDNPKLLKVSTEINVVSGIKYGKKLLFFLNGYPNGLGLAAVQTGHLRRVFVMRYGVSTIVISPQIKRFSQRKSGFNEGCLTFPGEYKWIERPTWVDVMYINGKMELISKTLRGMEARIFQHEFDHLNGIVCIKKEG